jgi:hypothetical protein
VRFPAGLAGAGAVLRRAVARATGGQRDIDDAPPPTRNADGTFEIELVPVAVAPRRAAGRGRRSTLADDISRD